MVPMSFDKLINQCLTEYRTKKSLFDVKAIVTADTEKNMEFCGRGLESPLGVAAGPHTQLAQNIVACYAGGARFIELKTVQRMFGEELGIQKPCIRANDEGYNVEWSSELHALEAMNEYIRAWFATKVVAKEFNLGDPDAFQFNMSVGYDLAGIKTEAVDGFLNGLNDASNTKVFQECKEYLLNNLDLFDNVDAEFVNSISAHICNTVTLSTMHGCPADEIEKIAAYLIEEKGFNTFIKCNPTLLGYEYVRRIMDDMGYDYEGIYQVSSCGRIRSVGRYVRNATSQYWRNGQIIKPWVGGTSPYYNVSLASDGKICKKLIHRLVAEHFLDDWNAAKEVNHKDGNKHNNRSDNLEMCTRQENVMHSMVHKLRDDYGENSVNAKLTNEQADHIRRLHRSGVMQNELAEQFKVCKQTICDIVHYKKYKK